MLDKIRSPRDLDGLSREQLRDLAAEIRRELVRVVAKNGGHLGPNLGCVELTIALHRIFRSPHDKIVFDTGHQTYVHKLLTRRHSSFDTLRQPGGLSGYPCQAESPHDLVENSHASTALSYADGLAKACRIKGEPDRKVVAVVGDGALTGGMTWEALNNIAAAPYQPVVIVVNDNGRSYSPTTGGLAQHLAALRLSHGYQQVLDTVRTTVTRTPRIGPPFFEFLRRAKRGLKDLLTPQSLFQDLGLKYLGPVDGHDLPALEHALQLASDFGGPIVVHCVTRKGHGYEPAEAHDEDHLHGPGPFDPVTGVQKPKSGTPWTSVFAEAIVELGEQREDLVAITAAMLHPTGLAPFARRFPDRVFDVGIAEQHAVTSAAGLAMGGCHPVVALYATFLNRAFDQVLMDVALHRLPVTFALDRAGITGDDGPSHNGMWDLSILQVVPHLAIAVPRDAATLRTLLREAVAITDGPTVVRYPKGPVPGDIPALDRLGTVDLVAGGMDGDVLLLAVGPMASTALDAASRLAERGIACTVVDPRWVRPFDPVLLEFAARHRVIAVVEDNCRTGAVGDAFRAYLHDHGNYQPVRSIGIPAVFPPHGKRSQLLDEFGITAKTIEQSMTELIRCPAGSNGITPDHGLRPV